MRKNIIITVIVLVGLAGAAIFWPTATCDATHGSCDSKQSRSSTILNELRTDKAILIDVREPSEYAAGHAEQAQLVPLGDIQAGKTSTIDKDKKLYVYCKSGRRAGIAKSVLETQGYAKVESIGSLTDWQSMGGKVVR